MSDLKFYASGLPHDSTFESEGLRKVLGTMRRVPVVGQLFAFVLTVLMDTYSGLLRRRQSYKVAVYYRTTVRRIKPIHQLHMVLPFFRPLCV